jgi:hypothetical protein
VATSVGVHGSSSSGVSLGESCGPSMSTSVSVHGSSSYGVCYRVGGIIYGSLGVPIVVVVKIVSMRC